MILEDWYQVVVFLSDRMIDWSIFVVVCYQNIRSMILKQQNISQRALGPTKPNLFLRATFPQSMFDSKLQLCAVESHPR